MPPHLFKQNWFTNISLNAASKLLRGDEADLERMEKNFISNFYIHLLNTQKKLDPELNEITRFFSFAYLHQKKSKAQILQDLWVLYMTQEKREGYFVEFGACDGRSLSNTLLLENEFGWTGILAEPNPTWHDALTNNRKCTISKKCVHNNSNETIHFSCSTIPELSRITEIIPDDVHERTGNRQEEQSVIVETISLLDLLMEHKAPYYIDYLSIDTEGSEYIILQDFDFSAYQFGLITIEHAGEKEKRDALFNLLTDNGYKRWPKEMTRWDDWYYKP